MGLPHDEQEDPLTRSWKRLELRAHDMRPIESDRNGQFSTCRRCGRKATFDSNGNATGEITRMFACDNRDI